MKKIKWMVGALLVICILLGQIVKGGLFEKQNDVNDTPVDTVEVQGTLQLERETSFTSQAQTGDATNYYYGTADEPAGLELERETSFTE
mgnify:FL=1